MIISCDIFFQHLIADLIISCDIFFQHLIADFRARGGRIKLKPRVKTADNERQESQQRKRENNNVRTNINC